MSIKISSLLLAFLLILARSSPAEELILYCSPRSSSSSLRIILALAYKGILFKQITVRSEDLHSLDFFRNYNPPACARARACARPFPIKL